MTENETKEKFNEKPKFEISKSPFIEYLESLTVKDNRGVLAVLRRGLQHEPGACIEMYPYIIPWLQEIKGKWQKQIHYLVASLFAYHPISSPRGNLGEVFRTIYLNRGQNPSIEQRFTILLRSSIEDLSFHIRQAISLAKSENIPINWNELFFDLKRWPYEKNYPPYEKWAQSFWKKEPIQENNQE